MKRHYKQAQLRQHFKVCALKEHSTQDAEATLTCFKREEEKKKKPDAHADKYLHISVGYLYHARFSASSSGSRYIVKLIATLQNSGGSQLCEANIIINPTRGTESVKV